MLTNQVIEDNKKVEKELHSFKEKVGVLMNEMLNEHEKNLREKIMSDNYEYKSLYDYTGIEELSSEFDNPKNCTYVSPESPERKTFSYNHQKLKILHRKNGNDETLAQKDLGDIYNDEKWLNIKIGSQQYGILSTYGKLITYTWENSKMTLNNITDYKFRIPQLCIKTILVVKTGIYYSDTHKKIRLEEFLVELKKELEENVCMSPYGEKIMKKYIILQKESEKHQETIKGLSEEISKLKRIEVFNNSLRLQNMELLVKEKEYKEIIEKLTQKIEILEKTSPHPPEDEMIAETKT